VKGLLGIGLPTIAISMMSQVIEPRLAIIMTIIPMFASNLWQVYRSGNIIRTIRKYWVFSLALSVTILFTSTYSKSVSSDGILIALGSVIITYAVLGLLKWAPKISARHDSKAQAGFGTTAGLLGGFTAIWAPPLIIYLTSRDTPKEEFIRATGLLITLGSAPLIIGYMQNGLLTSDLSVSSSLMVFPALFGFLIGEYLRKYIAAEKFSAIILVIFAVMGTNLIYRGFTG
jgi:uncharacterized membrane protein YfcA